MTKSFMDQLNETPVTYGVLLVYVTCSYLTGGLGMDTETEALIRFGGCSGFLVQDGQLWRILSSAFLHGNLIHLAMNSFALLQLGPPLERYLRTWRFIILYLVSAATCSLLALFANDPIIPQVGGSGALFGMLGAMLALNIRGGRTLLDFTENHGARMLIGTILFYLVAGYFIPVISNSGHFGGLVGGFVLVFCFFDRGRRREIDGTGRAIQLGWIAVLVAMLVYQSNPVLRYDFAFRQYLTATDQTRKVQLGETLGSSPRAVIDQFEQMFRERGLDEYRRALRAWKKGG